MAKISLDLVFAIAMVMGVALHSVMGEENPWKAVIDEASKAGVSPETIREAERAIEDGSAQKAAEDAFGSDSLKDWVQQANDMARATPSGLPIVLPDDEVEVGDSPAESPLFSRKAKSPSEAPRWEPAGAPKHAPFGAPSPKSSHSGAPTPTPSKAPTPTPRS